MEALHMALQIRLAKENIFFGPGFVHLLKLTEQYQSLNAAAKSINLSYAKANKMIKGAEEALNFKLLTRKVGGAGGGGSTLTDECKEFLEKYSFFEEEIKSATNEIFEKYFKNYI